MNYQLLLFLCFFSICGYSQQMADFKAITATVEPIRSEKKVLGTVRVDFISLQQQDSLFLDAKNMTVTQQALEGVPVTADSTKIWLHGPFEEGRNYTAFFSYEATPSQAMYFTFDQIWTQGQGKYTSHWLPSLDIMTDKIVFDLTVVAPEHETVIANGSLVSTAITNGKKHWKFDMQQPMASYLVALAIGSFDKTELDLNGMPIQLYYRPKDSLKWEPTYRYTADIFRFLESEIGIPFPWQNYKQVPISDFMYAGMENTTTTFFSQAFVVDSIGFKDRNYVNVNAHELAHQWFGNLITETEGTHHWLHEGFATYYALCAEREIFGTEYYYWKLYNTAEQLKSLSDQGKGERLLDSNASSITFYEKGAWALHILNEIMGETVFRAGIKKYLEHHAFQNVTTDDFVSEMQRHTEADLGKWKKDWLQQTAFKAEEAFNSLMKSPFMQSYFDLAALRNKDFGEKQERLRTGITSDNDFLGQEAVYQLVNVPFEQSKELLQLVLQQENVFTKQALALSMAEIPKDFQVAYEALLKEPSYLTQEAALYNLWMNFPNKRREYLDSLDGELGFQDRNLRQLWLVLAIYTDSYLTPEKVKFSDELQGYTDPKFSFEIREKAFDYLQSMELMTDKVIINLVEACTHHYWRFRDAARGLLDAQMEKGNTRDRLVRLAPNFSVAEKAYLKRKYDIL